MTVEYLAKLCLYSLFLLSLFQLFLLSELLKPLHLWLDVRLTLFLLFSLSEMLPQVTYKSPFPLISLSWLLRKFLFLRQTFYAAKFAFVPCRVLCSSGGVFRGDFSPRNPLA